MKPHVRIALVAALLAALAGQAALAGSHRLRLEIRDRHDGGLDLSLDGPLATGLFALLLAPTHLECDRDQAADTTAMMRYLDGHPEGSTYTLWRHGEEVRAARRDGELILNVVSRHGDRVDVEVPWLLARCALGETTSLREVLRQGDGLKIRVDGRDGSVRIDVR